MAPKHKPLDQQVIVITGASSGIGLCTAHLAAQNGAKLVLIARSAGVLQGTAQTITSSGGDAIWVAADVADRAQVLAAADAAINRFGRIDTWVNNAGVSIYGRLDQIADADSRRLFDIDFWGTVNGSLAALPWLRVQGGALVNMGSEACETVVPLQGMYTSAMHAIKGFTHALRVEIEEVDKAPVSITLIQPTAVNTPICEHARNYMAAEPKFPIRPIDPRRVAGAILGAALHGGRDIKVGAMAMLSTNVNKVMPRLGDKVSARQAGRQQRSEHARHPEGTLYEPGESGRIYAELEA